MEYTPKYLTGRHHPIDPANRKLCFVHCGKSEAECACYQALTEDISVTPDAYDRILPHIEPYSFDNDTHSDGLQLSDVGDGMVLLVTITCIALVVMLAATAGLALWILY